MYNPKEIKEKELPKPGTQVKGKVDAIKEGLLGDFVGKDALESWKNAAKDDNCIEVSVKLEDGSVRKQVISTPQDNQAHPKSKLMKWNKAYGGFPIVGQEVYLTADAEGWFNFSL